MVAALVLGRSPVLDTAVKQLQGNGIMVHRCGFGPGTKLLVLIDLEVFMQLVRVEGGIESFRSRNRFPVVVLTEDIPSPSVLHAIADADALCISARKVEALSMLLGLRARPGEIDKCESYRSGEQGCAGSCVP